MSSRSYVGSGTPLEVEAGMKKQGKKENELPQVEFSLSGPTKQTATSTRRLTKMKNLKGIVAIAALTLSLSSSTFAGTIIGSRTQAATGTIIGSRTDSATGTIIGSRSDSVKGTIIGSRTEDGFIGDDLVARIASAIAGLVW
jgi:hypothetical protein